MAKKWTAEAVMRLTTGYQAGLVLMAAAELDLFAVLGAEGSSSREAAGRLRADPRGLGVLIDALAALGLLAKSGQKYRPAPGTLDCLTAGGRSTMLAMTRHQGNCVRRWVQLAAVVKTGRPAERCGSILGPAGDQASFITAMDNLSGPMADGVVAKLKGVQFDTVLDVGGASGSWTLAFLRANPRSRAILFDLPVVIPMARKRLGAAGVLGRVKLVPGDFYQDPLPVGADLAWVSAIVHQNSRAQNRALYAKVARALPSGGRIAIRDVVMDGSRTRPVAGALFAINMLCGPHEGGTFTLAEFEEDLTAAGFGQVRLVHRDPWMNSLVTAVKSA